jgi:hypothetical protein
MALIGRPSGAAVTNQHARGTQRTAAPAGMRTPTVVRRPAQLVHADLRVRCNALMHRGASRRRYAQQERSSDFRRLCRTKSSFTCSCYVARAAGVD